MSKTIESELKRYRLCRAEMESGCDVDCAVCVNNIPRMIFALFGTLEETLEGEK